MRMCISCGEPIPADKRKDARYCGQSKCRGREYRKRHPKPAAVGHHEPQTSTVLACPCGRRYLLSVAELHEHAAVSAVPSLPVAVTRTDARTEPDSPLPSQDRAIAITQTASQTDPPTIAPAESPQQQADHAAKSDTQTVPVMDARLGEREILKGEQDPSAHEDGPRQGGEPGATVPVTAHESVTPPCAPESQRGLPPLTTLELTFCDATGRPLSFSDAVTRDAAGHWALRAGARAVFRCGDADPRGLGGMPGRWPRFYAGRSPTAFGFDGDLVVMFWDHRQRRGRAASAKVLQGILGDNWKVELRKIRDERLRVPTDRPMSG